VAISINAVNVICCLCYATVSRQHVVAGAGHVVACADSSTTNKKTIKKNKNNTKNTTKTAREKVGGHNNKDERFSKA
jgi:hypothetical protein